MWFFISFLWCRSPSLIVRVAYFAHSDASQAVALQAALLNLSELTKRGRCFGVYLNFVRRSREQAKRAPALNPRTIFDNCTICTTIFALYYAIDCETVSSLRGPKVNCAQLKCGVKHRNDRRVKSIERGLDAFIRAPSIRCAVIKANYSHVRENINFHTRFPH